MWKGKDIFSAKMTGVKRRELDPGLSFPLQNFIEDLPGEVYDNYYISVCDSGHRKVFVFHSNQVNL